jgi:hypothetical protein
MLLVILLLRRRSPLLEQAMLRACCGAGDPDLLEAQAMLCELRRLR